MKRQDHNQQTGTTVRLSNITIYTPESHIRHPARLFRDMFRDLLVGRELAWRLAVRDIRAQYRQTALGLLWAFILPLANTLIWIFLNSSGIINITNTSMPYSYSVYVFSGTMIWAIFIDAFNAPLQQTMASKQMLAKINFPREALVVSGIYQTLFNGAIRIILLLSVLMLFKIYPGWTLAFFPLGILSLILTGTALGLLLTPIGMLYTDIGRGIPLVMQFLMYLSPVVLPMPTKGWALILFRTNPMTPLILTTRDWLTGLSPEYLGTFFLINLFMIALLLAVWVIYRAAMPILIERMSA